MKVSPIPLTLVAVLFLLFLLPQLIVPAQQGQPSPNDEELKEVQRLKQSVVELFKQGKFDEALPPAQRALEIEKRLLGPTSQRVAVSLNNLAEIHLAKKNYEEAETLFAESLAIFEKAEARNAELIENVLGRLATLRFFKKDYAKAAALLERSLALAGKTSGSDNKRTAETMFELAVIYQKQAHYEKAEPLFLKSLKLKEKLLGVSDEDTVKAMKIFACGNLLSRQDPKDFRVVDEPFDENQALVARAYCWLGEFEDKCADSPGNQFGGRQGLLNGRALRLPKPDYPAEARAHGLSGTVFISVLLDEKGNVIKARGVCGGDPVLTGASLGSARGAKFSATLFNGTPIQATGIITYRYIRQ